MLFKSYRRLLFFLFFSLGSVVSQQIEQVPLSRDKIQIIDEDFSRFVKNELDSKHVKGLSLAIVKANEGGDGDVEFGSWGIKTEDGDAVDSKTLFSIGSCTKAFLATSLGILMEDYATGRNVTPLPAGVTEFNWQSKVGDLLPGTWKLKDEWASQKTDVRDVLTHMSGLVGQDLAYGPGDTQRDVVLRMRHLETAVELRELSSYNNAMYMAAAYLLSIYANQTFPEFAQERIFEPLGMHSTTMYLTEAERSGHLSQAWAQPIVNDNSLISAGRRIPFWLSEEMVQLTYGAAGIISNVEDMAKWIDVQLHKGVIPSTNATVIPRSVFDAVTTSSVITRGYGLGHESIIGYGLGWGRWSIGGHETIRHTGGIPGFLSVVTFFPHDGLGIISLTNTDEGNKVNAGLVNRILSDYFGHHLRDSSPDRINPFPIRHDTVISESDARGLRTAISMDDYVGTYTNLAYGNITLCSSGVNQMNDACTPVVRDFAVVDEATGKINETHLVAYWPRAWSSHLRIIPAPDSAATQGNFVMDFVRLFTEGYGDDKSPWEYTMGSGSLRFVRSTSQGGYVTGFKVCGIAGRQEDYGDTCQQFEAGLKVKEGWLVAFDRVADF